MRNYLPTLFLFFLASSILSIGCEAISSAEQNTKVLFTASENKDDFAEYWFAGEAELNTYDITQNRYGEVRNGEAIMVFVTEDFSKSKQVKLDNSSSAGNDKVPVMKFNHIRRFITGIYDYSMMQSVFTPIDLKKNEKTLKATTSSQDWCGHSFTQLNLEGGKYKMSGFSYFESEGDEVKKIPADLLEDELWARIRIAPKSIPTGNIKVIPSAFFSRLYHTDLDSKSARIQFEEKEGVNYLNLEYLHLKRTLRIGFDSNFPHNILEWKETTEGELTSFGKLKATIKSPYWRQHDNAHEHLRDSLRMR